jgi:hypothetical protein
MRKLFILIAIIISCVQANAQVLQSVPRGNPNFLDSLRGYMKVMRDLTVMEDVYFKGMVADPNKVLALDANNKLYQKTVSSGSAPDSNIYATVKRLNDSLLNYLRTGDSVKYTTIARLRDSILAVRTWVLAQGYITGYTETDPIWDAQKTLYLQKADSGLYTSVNRLNDSLQHYLRKGDSDRYVTIARLKDSILSVRNWVTAQGYLTVETDPEWNSDKGNYYNKTETDGLLDGKQDVIGYTPENVANKVTTVRNPTNTTYPTSKAVTDTLQDYPKWNDTTDILATNNDLLQLPKDTPVYVSRVLIEGQSNVGGDADTALLTDYPLNRIQFNLFDTFNRVFISDTFGTYRPLKLGFNTYGDSPPRFGPELGLAMQWVKSNPSGLLFIDKKYMNGAQISLFLDGTTHATKLEQQRDSADKWLRARGLTPVDVGWYWNQGESDNSDDSTTYRTKLNQLYQDRMSEGLIDFSTRPMIVTMPASSTMYGAGVRAAQVGFVNSNRYARLQISDTISLGGDNLHFDTEGLLQLGVNAHTLLFDGEPAGVLDTSKNIVYTSRTITVNSESRSLSEDVSFTIPPVDTANLDYRIDSLAAAQVGKVDTGTNDYVKNQFAVAQNADIRIDGKIFADSNSCIGCLYDSLNTKSPHPDFTPGIGLTIASNREDRIFPYLRFLFHYPPVPSLDNDMQIGIDGGSMRFYARKAGVSYIFVGAVNRIAMLDSANGLSLYSLNTYSTGTKKYLVGMGSSAPYRVQAISSIPVEDVTGAATTTQLDAKVDSVTKPNDTFYYWKGATKYFAGLDATAGGGGGEANTASNLGGGLANYDSKSGVDLRFNSFNASHFDVASNLISIEASIISDIADGVTSHGWGDHALAGYELASNKSTSTSLGTSNTLFPSQGAVKAYVDAAIAALSSVYANISHTHPQSEITNLPSDLAAKLTIAKYTVRETPSGSVNGSNTAYTLANTPVSGTVMVFLNGLLQDEGGSDDYTISTNTITFNTAPISGDKIRVTYISQ